MTNTAMTIPAGPSWTSSTGRWTGSTGSAPTRKAQPAGAVDRRGGRLRGPAVLRRAVGPLQPGGQLAARPGRGPRRPDPADAGQPGRAVGTMLAAMKLGAVVIPATTLLAPADLRDRIDRGRGPARRGRAATTPASSPTSRQLVGGSRSATPVAGPAGPTTPTADADRPTFTPDGADAGDRPAAAVLHLGHHGQAQAGRAHPRRRYPVGHLSTMYWIGLRARRRAPEHLLAGLGQARLEQRLRAVERRAPPC